MYFLCYCEQHSRVQFCNNLDCFLYWSNVLDTMKFLETKTRLYSIQKDLPLLEIRTSWGLFRESWRQNMNYNLSIFFISRENTIKKQTYHPIGHQTSSQPPYQLLDIGKVKKYIRFLLYKMAPLSIYSSMGPATIPSCNFFLVSS